MADALTENPEIKNHKTENFNVKLNKTEELNFQEIIEGEWNRNNSRGTYRINTDNYQA